MVYGVALLTNPKMGPEKNNNSFVIVTEWWDYASIAKYMDKETKMLWKHRLSCTLEYSKKDFHYTMIYQSLERWFWLVVLKYT